MKTDVRLHADSLSKLFLMTISVNRTLCSTSEMIGVYRSAPRSKSILTVAAISRPGYADVSFYPHRNRFIMKKLIVLGLVIATSGCAAMRASAARQKHIEDTVTAYTYQQSCGEVWSTARTMLFGQDYQVKSADAAAGLTLETEWKSLSGGTSARYMFQGKQPTDDSCKVVATKATKDQAGKTSTVRDWNIEWDLLQQVDTVAAANIKTDAEKAGEAAAAAE